MNTPVSVVLITLNAAQSLEKCLQSCSWAEQIVVVDSGSQDETLAIAQRYQAKIIHQDWLGFGKQKQLAVQQADHDWVLCLDADEWLSETLARNIRKMLQNPSHQSYLLTRCNCFMGRFLRHGEGYPDRVLRLFNRHYANWSDHEVHEYVISNGQSATLDGDLMHESGEDIRLYLDKQNRYTTLQAQQLYTAGKQIGVGKLLFSPLLRFMKFYLLRQGFRDGVPGLVHIAIGCWNSFIKYAKLLELWRQGATK